MRRGRFLRASTLALALAGVATLGGLAGAGASPASSQKPQVVKGSGDIAPKMDEFRTLLGADNGGAPTQNATGRREINWDAVPDDLASPKIGRASCRERVYISGQGVSR